MLLLQQMIVLFIYIMIGYAACRKGMLDEEFGVKISWVVVNIANPMLTVSAVVNGDGTIKGYDLLITAILAASTFALLILLAYLMPHLLRVKPEDKSVYKVMTTFNNIGFMGYPVIVAVYGQEALLYAVIFSMMFNVLIYTWGIQTLKGISGKIQWKRILNVGVASSVLAITLYFLQLPMPDFIKTTTSGLSNLTAPLSMMVIGISLTSIPLKELFTDARLLIYSGIKLLIIPIAVMLVICYFVDNRMLCEVCLIMMATPAASMCAMLPQQYGGNQELAAKGVALTTLLSVVTIPMVSAVIF